jgi:hypothetical protein
MADVEPILERVETGEGAERLRFIGSPTILVDGRDAFAGPIPSIRPGHQGFLSRTHNPVGLQNSLPL